MCLEKERAPSCQALFDRDGSGVPSREGSQPVSAPQLVVSSHGQFHHRDPGIVGLLTSDKIPAGRRVFYGMISDGIHTNPAALRIAHRAHPEGELCQASPAVPSAGLSATERSRAARADPPALLLWLDAARDVLALPRGAGGVCCSELQQSQRSPFLAFLRPGAGDRRDRWHGAGPRAAHAGPAGGGDRWAEHLHRRLVPLAEGLVLPLVPLPGSSAHLAAPVGVRQRLCPPLGFWCLVALQ